MTTNITSDLKIISDSLNKLENLVPNELEDTYASAIESLRKIAAMTHAELRAVETNISANLKKLVVEKLKPTAIVNPADIYVQIDYPSGWYAIVHMHPNAFFFKYDYLNDSYSLEQI